MNAIGPGAIDTPMNESWMNNPQEKQKVESYIPMQWIGRPDEIASVAAVPSSDEASYLTGQIIFVDGGMMLWPEFRNR